MDGIEKLRCRMTPVQGLKGPVVNGLEAEFDPDRMIFPIRLQKFENGIRYAVGTGTDGKTDYVIMRQGFVVNGLQMFQGRIGVGKGLKIGDKFPRTSYLQIVGFAVFDLLGNGREWPRLPKF